MAVEASDLRFEGNGAAELSMFDIVGAAPGTAILAAAGCNGPGVGELQTGPGWVRWRAPGSGAFGPAVSIPAAGTYVLVDGEDENKWVRCYAVPARMDQAGAGAAVYLRDRWTTIYLAGTGEWNQIAGDDVTAAEAAAGDIKTWDFEVWNRHAEADIRDLVVWIDPAVQYLEVSVNGGRDWYAPTSEQTALRFGDLAPGSHVHLFVRRTIPAATPASPEKLVLFHFAWDAF